MSHGLRWAVGLAMGCVSALWAGDGAWNVDSDGLWSDGANWLNSQAAGGTGSTAYFTNSVSVPRTVTVDQPVTVEALRFGSPANNNWRFIGDGPIFLDGASINAKPRLGSTVNQLVDIFTPLAGANGFVQEGLPGDIELAGKNSGLAGLGEIRAYTVHQTMSKTADDASDMARNYFPTGGVILAGAQLELVGRKNGSAVTADWVLASGSARVQSSNASASSSLSPGQPVQGAGVPDGTYIRQILDGSNLVLSAAATQSGTSTLTFSAASFKSEQLLQRVRVDSAQSFIVNKNGGSSFTTTVERLYGNANLVLNAGDGTVALAGQREHRASILYSSGELTVAPRTVSRQPAAGAAFHVDASLADSLTTSGSEVTEWRDVNANGWSARAPDGSRPTLLSNALNGKPVVDFGTFGYSPYMLWYYNGSQTAMTTIRTVFWVFGSQNGGGFLLGGSSWAHFHRGPAPDGGFNPGSAASRIWGWDWYSYPGAGNVQTYIDGIRRDESAALNGGYQLITCQIGVDVTVDGFAMDRSWFPDRRGGQRLAEVLVYTRALSEAERIETEEYLTAKWFGDTRWDADGKDPMLTDVNAQGARTLGTPDSGTVTLGHLTGVGTLSKTGASTLSVLDAHDYLGTLSLGGGSLKFAVSAIPSAPASNAYFHVDASVTNSFVLDGTSGVLAWQDWRGNGRAASLQGGFVAPVFVPGVMNGKPVVDFGALGSLRALQWNHTNNNIRAAFLVFQSASSYASILGSVGSDQAQDFFRGSGGQLYNTDATPSRAVMYGANYVNGWQIDPMLTALPESFCVISALATSDARACAFAMNRTDMGQTGGQRLAEVIIYNRALTDQERRDTEAYLMYKWLGRSAPGYGAADAPVTPKVAFSGNSLTVQVDGTGTAALGSVSGNGDLIKTGTGALGVQGNLPLSGKVRVDQGTVASYAPGSSSPALSPIFHLDASRADTLTLAQENGTNFVTRWNSIGIASNAAVVRAGYARPWLLSNSGIGGGQPVVDFGPLMYQSPYYGACLQWEQRVSSIRTVFMVMGSQDGGGFFLGDTDQRDFHRGANSSEALQPITKDNAILGFDLSAKVANGIVYLDNDRVVNPFSRDVTFSGGYQLLEVLTTDSCQANLFAADRSFTDRAGGLRLAEVLVYDRVLSETERLQTENYLNAKWFVRTAVGSALGTVRVADGVGVQADVSPLTVNQLEGSGTVVKSGGDTLTLTDTTAFTGTVEVAGGTLALAVPAAPLAPPSNTFFWLDASKAGTVSLDASGYVSAWYDVTGNGLYATSSVAGHLPKLRTSDFAGRSVVDMGIYGGSSSSATMLWKQRLSGMKTIVWVLGSQKSGGYLLGVSDGVSFHRGPPPTGGEILVSTFSYSNYIYSASWGANIPTAAYTNGVGINTTTTGLSGGYQVLFQTWDGGTYADGFAFDRFIGDRYGGQRLAEFIVYDRVLTDTERLATDAYLNWKWFGKTTSGYSLPDTHTGVILHDGTSLTMGGSEQSVTSLAGSGAVSNGTLVVRGKLSPGLSELDCAHLTVDGNLTLASGSSLELDYDRPSHDLITVSGTLTVQGGGSVTARLPEHVGIGWVGRVPVMTFASGADVSNLLSWSVGGMPAGYTAGLEVDGQTVYLSVRAKGTLILLR